MNKSILLLVVISLITFVSALDIEVPQEGIDKGRIVNLDFPTIPPFDNSTGVVNVSTFADIWITTEGNMDDVSDIEHNWLSNLLWSVAGHVMDSVLVMNGNDIEEVGNITIEDRIFITDTDHWIKRGGEPLFNGIATETFWLHHDEEHTSGTITFLVTANNSGQNKINIMSQIGRNESAGVLGNSWMVIPNNLTENLTIYSNCFLVANELGKTLRVACDTSETGADLIVQDDIQSFGTVFADGGIRAETLADFVMDGNDLQIENGSLHILAPTIFETGVTAGDEVTTFNEFFSGGLGSFVNIQTDLGNWHDTASIFCDDGDCATALGISGVGNIIMEANISTVNIETTSLNFIYSLANILGGNSFTVTANNNVGSGEVVLFTDSTNNVVLSSQSIGMPASMWNQPNVGLRFECDVTNTNRECFVDTISVNGTAIATTLTNQSGFNSVIKFGDGTLAADGFPERGIIYHASNDTIEIRGNIVATTIIEQSLNITESITLDSETISNWENLTEFVQGIWNASGNDIFYDKGNVVIIGGLNVTGTSYLGDLIIQSDNITVNNIIPLTAPDIKLWGHLSMNENPIHNASSINATSDIITLDGRLVSLGSPNGTSEAASLFLSGSGGDIDRRYIAVLDNSAEIFTVNSQGGITGSSTLQLDAKASQIILDTNTILNDGNPLGVSTMTFPGSTTTLAGLSIPNTFASTNNFVGLGGITVAESIFHYLDPNSRIGLLPDALSFEVGGEMLLNLTESTQDIVAIGDGGDVDVQMKTLGDDNAFFLQGSSDNLGLGLNTPDTDLHIVGDGGSIDYQMTLQQGNSNDGEAPCIKFRNSVSGTNVFSSRICSVRVAGSGGRGDLSLSTNPGVPTADNNVERLRLMSTGISYFGTSTSSNKLLIEDDATVSINLQGSQGGGALKQFAKVGSDTVFDIFEATLDRGSGSGGIGMGLGYLFTLEDSSGARQDAGRFKYVWSDPTNGAEDASFTIQNIVDGSLKDSLIIDGAGDTHLGGGLNVSGLSGSYSNGEAYVCVYDNGTIFAKDSACS